jgi:hypothetical protein
MEAAFSMANAAGDEAMRSDTTVPADALGADLHRRDFMRYTVAAAGATGLASFVASTNQALAADGSVPADKSAAGYTLTAAYAASPPVEAVAGRAQAHGDELFRRPVRCDAGETARDRE